MNIWLINWGYLMLLNRVNSYSFNNKYQTNYSSVKNNSATSSISQQLLQKVPLETLKAYSFGSSIEKRKAIYNDTNKFAEHMLAKIDKQLMIPNKKEIKSIISEVSKETNASKKLVTEVLARVSQFGSTSQLPQLNKAFNEKNLATFFIRFEEPLNINHLFNIAENHKMQLDLDGEIRPYVVEDYNLQFVPEAEAYLDEADYMFSKMSLVLIDGWNTKVDGKSKTYTMFGAQDSLKNTTKAIVEEVQKTGKSIDEVLNGDIISKIKDMYGDKYQITVIKNPNLKYNARAIAKNLNVKRPNKTQIVELIEATAEYFKEYGTFIGKDKDRDTTDLKKSLMIYIDSMFDIYSSQRLNYELKKKHKAIQEKVNKLGKTMNDVYYIVPNKAKSFALISYQYAKVNDIPLDRFLTNGQANNNTKQGKVFVILDDLVGTGQSITKSEFDYAVFNNKAKNKKENDYHILFAPILATQKAKRNILSDPNYSASRFVQKRENQDFLLANKVLDYEKCMQDHLEEDDYDNLGLIMGHRGYGACRTFCQFPFSLPDNNSDFATLFSYLFANKQLVNACSDVSTSDYSILTKELRLLNENK